MNLGGVPLPQLQSSVTEFEFSQEDYRMLQVEFWSKFYACCLQYQEALSTPLALHISQATAMVCLLKKVPGPPTRGRGLVFRWSY